MPACFLFPFQNEYDGYMLTQVFFGSFYHPFQDGYKSSIIQILFPWLVQGEYLNYLLQYFLYAKTVTKCWCSVGMFFDRCTNFKFINWYPDMTIWILVQCTVLSYRQAFLESTEISASEELNALEVAPAQFMALRILGGKGEVQIMPFRKLSGKCHFLLRFCTRNWSETYIFLIPSLFYLGSTWVPVLLFIVYFPSHHIITNGIAVNKTVHRRRWQYQIPQILSAKSG